VIPLFDQKTESRTNPLPFWDHGTSHAAWLDWPYKLHTNPVTTRYKKSKQDTDLPVTLLYDVSKDPKETTDLAAQEPERVAKMTAALQAWKASVEKSFAGAGQTQRRLHHGR
jgi:arylsulfatase A-like enzyme